MLLALGIVVLSWAYAVFGSWRLDATIDSSHRLMTSGPYRFVRHPIYLALNLYFLGWFLVLGNVGFLLQFLLNLAAMDWRLRVEESVMRQAFPDEYPAYAARTARQIPGLY